MKDNEYLIKQANLLIARLERISADSTWARRSSGHRGALIKWVEHLDVSEGAPTGIAQITDSDRIRLKTLITNSYGLLERAAKEYLG